MERTTRKYHAAMDRGQLHRAMAIILCAFTSCIAVACMSETDVLAEEVSINEPQKITPFGRVRHETQDSIELFEVNGVEFKMVRVEGGTFIMGASEEQEAEYWDNETPAREVTLSTYYIGETEVTQALYETVMCANPSFNKGDSLPVEHLVGHDCLRFVMELSRITGRNFRLPTEAEWEFAARGGNRSKGYKYSGSDSVDKVAYYHENSGGNTHPVAQKAPNELGLYDMSGNVWEWCSDWYGAYPNENQCNPKGPQSGTHHARRGGSWYSPGRSCRVSTRLREDPKVRYDYYRGMRLVMDQ